MANFRSDTVQINDADAVKRQAQSAVTRRLDIQGLRAIAVLMVVAFHAGMPVPGGFVGVDVFFVISGFVITAMLRREWQQTSRIEFARFYLRRFKRLTPALAVVVTVTIGLSALVLSPMGTQQTAARTGIGAMLLVANGIIYKTTGGYFDAPAHENPLLNTWSLSVEEQFYLVFPVLLLLVWRIGKRRGTNSIAPWIVVGLVTALSFCLAVLSTTQHKHVFSGFEWLVSFYSPVVRVWEFSAGALVALAGGRFAHPSRHTTTALAYTGFAALSASLWVISDATPFPGMWTLLPVLGTVFLLLAGNGSANLVTRALSRRPMVAIGDWSYSIYLWHWPLIVFAGVLWPGEWRPLLAAVILSLALALASYYIVEQPIRAAPSSGKLGIAGLVTTTLLLPLLAGASLDAAARSWFWSAPLKRMMEPIEARPTGFDDPKCISRVPVSQRDVRPCQWHSETTGVPVYLVGDSNAVHFSDALIGAGATLRRPVTVLGADGCPLLDGFIKRRTDASLLAECRLDYLALLAWLTQQPPGTVMIASVDRYWRDADYQVSAVAKPGGQGNLSSEDALNAGLEKTVRALQAAGHFVTLIQAVPPFIEAPYKISGRACSGWHVLTGACQPPSGTMPLEFADDLQSKSRAGIQRVSIATGARLFDLREVLCPQRVCSTRHESGVDLYMLDGYHFNRGGSALLEGAFVAELSTAAR